MKTSYRSKNNSTAPAATESTQSTSLERRDLSRCKIIHAKLSSEMRLSNSLSAKIGPLVEAIMHHAHLPATHDMAVDPKAAERAIEILGRLMYNYPIDAPTFFPQEGEEVIFKWDGKKIGRYLSVSNDDVNLMDLEPLSQNYCEYHLYKEDGSSSQDDFDFDTLVNELTSSSLSSTSIQAQDA